MTAQTLPGLATPTAPKKRERVTALPAPNHCPTCHAPTIAAWRDGLYEDVHTDPVALTPLGELQALATGRRTYTHWNAPGGGLDQRTPDSIARWPAGCDLTPIRPEHRCGSPPPDHLPAPTRAADRAAPPF